MTRDVKPNFLGVGAARCGTTTLHDYLLRHPDVFVPIVKELHYFTYRHEVRGFREQISEADYCRYFKGAKNATALGEISPSYFWFPDTAKLIKAFEPSMKIVVLLRNPVERAISDFQYSWKYNLNAVDLDGFVSSGIEQLRDNGIASQSFHPTTCLWKGLYARHLCDYLEHFGRKRVRVFLFEDLIERPHLVQRDLCRFLGVRCPENLPFVVRSARPGAVPVSLQARDRLLDFYEEDIAICSQIIGRDLSHWQR
jgi:hypothetical protein